MHRNVGILRRNGGNWDTARRHPCSMTLAGRTTLISTAIIPSLDQVTPDIALAEGLFDDLDRGTRTGIGIVRDSYGPGEQFAHDVMAAAAQELGLRIVRDAALNLYLTLEGENPSAPSVLVGSHLDSVNGAGNFDGAAGVISGMAAVAGFVRAGRKPPQDVTVMGIRAEESVWFDSGYVGSMASLGRLDPAHLDAVRRSDTGRTLADHMADHGADIAAVRAGRAFLDPRRIGSYIEVHIEQGRGVWSK